MGQNTEEQILDAAQQVFTKRGFEGARMQQIADVAEVNKSMLHYYYRSKKELFKRVYRDAIARILPQLLELLNSDYELEKKIPRLVERYIGLLRENPRLPSFVLQEINQNPEDLLDYVEGLGMARPDKFLEQIRQANENGDIKQIEPEQLLVNIVSLCVFPFAARPMIKFMLQIDDQEFEQFLEERTRTLSPFILNAIT